MELARYPLDQQICSLKMESYSHDYKELQLYVSLKLNSKATLFCLHLKISTEIHFQMKLSDDAERKQ